MLNIIQIISIGFIFNVILAFKFWTILRYKITQTIIICLVIVILGMNLYPIIDNLENTVTEKDNYKQEVIELSKDIPKNESLLGYNIPAKWYYVADLLPSNKYFTLQDWWASFDKSINNHINEYFDDDPPTWVVTSNINDISNEYVKSFIEKNYELIDKNSTGELYKIRKH